jgi:NADPH-dependent curcumin reductase CurA
VSDRNRRLLIRRIPAGPPHPTDFELTESPMPQAADGEVLVRTQWLSLDPYVRSLLSGRHFLALPQAGDVLPARAVAEVLESRHPLWRKGDVLALETGIQEYVATRAEGAWKLRADHKPASLALGVLGMPGMTAWFGLLDVGRLKPGELVLVSAASGPVGSMVGQIAKRRGARAIGIAGGKAKCDWVVNAAHFDACIDYKSEDLSSRLRALAPNGVDVFFDNTGGTLQNTVIMDRHLALGARVVLCGLIAQYNLAEAPPGPNLGRLMACRGSILTMIVYDYENRREEFFRDVLPWHATGGIAWREDIGAGIENAADQFCRLMHGENFGKTLVRLGGH